MAPVGVFPFWDVLAGRDCITLLWISGGSSANLTIPDATNLREFARFREVSHTNDTNVIYNLVMSDTTTKRTPGRPAEFGRRVTKAVRLDPELDERLKAEAEARNLSANLLINRAVAEYLDRLVPLDQVLKTAS